MKRTPLKRKTPLKAKTGIKHAAKRSKLALKKKKTPSIRILKDKLWNECKRITRARFPHTCYTCGRQGLSGSDLQTGHGKPKGALPLRFQYDIRNLRIQCLSCNVHRGGMTDIFIAKLEQEDEGYAFLVDACYFDENDLAWHIRRDTELLRGRDATIFIQKLLEQYRSYQP